MRRFRQLTLATRNACVEKSRLRISSEVWWVESQLVIIELVQRNLGWALVPEYIVAEALEEGSLVLPKLDFDNNSWSMAVELIWHKEKSFGKAGAWLKQAITTYNW